MRKGGKNTKKQRKDDSKKKIVLKRKPHATNRGKGKNPVKG